MLPGQFWPNSSRRRTAHNTLLWPTFELPSTALCWCVCRYLLLSSLPHTTACGHRTWFFVPSSREATLRWNAFIHGMVRSPMLEKVKIKLEKSKNPFGIVTKLFTAHPRCSWTGCTVRVRWSWPLNLMLQNSNFIFHSRKCRIEK